MMAVEWDANGDLVRKAVCVYTRVRVHNVCIYVRDSVCLVLAGQ